MANSSSWILVMEYSPNYCDVRQFVRRYGAFTEKLAKHVYIQVGYKVWSFILSWGASYLVLPIYWHFHHFLTFMMNLKVPNLYIQAVSLVRVYQTV